MADHLSRKYSNTPRKGLIEQFLRESGFEETCIRFAEILTFAPSPQRKDWATHMGIRDGEFLIHADRFDPLNGGVVRRPLSAALRDKLISGWKLVL